MNYALHHIQIYSLFLKRSKEKEEENGIIIFNCEIYGLTFKCTF